MLKIAHVIERFGSAGPERSILAWAKAAARAGLAQQHVVCPLTPAFSPLGLALARQVGVEVVRTSAADVRDAVLTAADIVVVHFWNSPALYAFLRGPLPAMRLLVWLKIFGSHPPQVAPAALHGFADLLVATSPGTLALPAFAPHAATMPVVNGIADFDRLAGCEPQPHAGCCVGYVGGISPGKIHPAFVQMSAAVAAPGVRFVVCGADGEKLLGAQVQAAGAAGRFEFRGYVENICTVLAGCDIFGYPLAPDTYATSEKALQEAMWVGLPPVVFPHGGVRYLVEEGVTGRVVETPRAYTQAIDELCRNPAERRRLGDNARAFARVAFDPQRAVTALAALCGQLLQRPKRERAWPHDGDTPADWFVAALGEHSDPFARSVQGADANAEAEIAASSALLSRGEGGIIHYRNAYPDDPHLRRWAHLVTAAEAEGQKVQDGRAGA